MNLTLTVRLQRHMREIDKPIKKYFFDNVKGTNEFIDYGKGGTTMYYIVEYSGESRKVTTWQEWISSGEFDIDTSPKVVQEFEDLASAKEALAKYKNSTVCRKYINKFWEHTIYALQEADLEMEEDCTFKVPKADVIEFADGDTE